MRPQSWKFKLYLSDNIKTDRESTSEIESETESGEFAGRVSTSGVKLYITCADARWPPNIHDHVQIELQVSQIQLFSTCAKLPQ